MHALYTTSKYVVSVLVFDKYTECQVFDKTGAEWELIADCNHSERKVAVKRAISSARCINNSCSTYHKSH